MNTRRDAICLCQVPRRGEPSRMNNALLRCRERVCITLSWHDEHLALNRPSLLPPISDSDSCGLDATRRHPAKPLSPLYQHRSLSFVPSRA